jgi:xanthine dehydrogenase accessory factor
MRAWIAPLIEALDRGEGAMLVHVADLKGSGPREVGAQMLVSESGMSGTIGGGELEHTAIRRARELLAVSRAAMSPYALGPELSQCCGGAVTLAFEPFAPADRVWLGKLLAAASIPVPVVRTVRLDFTGGLRRGWSEGEAGPDYLANLADGVLLITERINPTRHALWLFGAGHVGRAVARAVAPLGFSITWIDGRAGHFPDPPPPGVRTLELAMPELAADEAPESAWFLVMTHSHPLDEAICEAVLRRGDFRYLGLIGSKSKRARFRKRLAAAGITRDKLDQMTCPIGLPQIRSKEPAAIAASVAADLLIRRERTVLTAEGRLLHGG